MCVSNIGIGDYMNTACVYTEAEKERLLKTILPRLRKEVQPDGRTCWLWTGAVMKTSRHKGQGYGYVRVGSRIMTVRRVLYQLAHPKKTHLLSTHTLRGTCSNSLCVNPAHMVLTETLKSNGPTHTSFQEVSKHQCLLF